MRLFAKTYQELPVFVPVFLIKYASVLSLLFFSYGGLLVKSFFCFFLGLLLSAASFKEGGLRNGAGGFLGFGKAS